MQKLFKPKYYFKAARYTEKDISQMKRFSIRQIYKDMQGEFQKATWRKLVCNNQGLPKWTFIMILALLNRLATKDRLAKWGIIPDQLCHLCEKENKTVQHLFFEYEVTGSIWQQLLYWQGIQRVKKKWQEEIQWIEQFAKGKSAGAAVCRMTFAATVYHVW
ncbi:uncharacterized protein LOC107830057 [Nicotiana tabacum]|uniref:Uncharacterized protein LOC107830057 n=1 Tax=Nicotiana tabacum TaxID=4097 RepID=A0A1S4DI39_TOBAC|nr:uncharacterized protein LOC104113884 [Nicotiana tomentosiformis]XP_016513027.1 PREDICTED: uncharacterized protein LOC107830057 [Nicotiana tabacum]